MSFWTAAVIIVAIWGIVQVFAGRGRHPIEPADENRQPLPTPGEEAELKREIGRLRERLEVLERITTDANSSEARERRRLESEIDSLRERDLPPN